MHGREYFLLKSFYALQDNYDVMKSFKKTQNIKRVFVCFEALHKYYLKKSVKTYKIKIVKENKNHRTLTKIVQSWRNFARKYSHCKRQLAMMRMGKFEHTKRRLLMSWFELQ